MSLIQILVRRILVREQRTKMMRKLGRRRFNGNNVKPRRYVSRVVVCYKCPFFSHSAVG